MINNERYKQIKDIAEFIAANNANKLITNLEQIAAQENVMIDYDHYNDYFDGLLTYLDDSFVIHINEDKGNIPGKPRTRFSIAHELAHYFLDEHRQGIISGEFEPHPSNFNIKQNNIMEFEADTFAAHLLMPSDKYKRVCGKEMFSFDLIERLSASFNTSKLSTLIRFTSEDAGTYPLMAFFFKDKKLEWFIRSNDFPFKAFHSKIGKPPPKNTVLEEYYRESLKLTTVEKVDAQDWFYNAPDIEINEQCFYSYYGYDVSMVWPD